MAKTAGFCFGVNRAVELTYGLLAEGHKVATLGPLIHNPQAVEDMRRKGAQVVDTVQDVPAGCEVVIRSHGVPRSVYDELEARGIPYHDATCPFVQKIQRIAAEAEKEGAVLLVAGDKTHPEVQGIVGHTRGEVFVFADLAELEAWNGPSDPQKPLFAVAQTTFQVTKWKESSEFLKKAYTNARIFDTICNATWAPSGPDGAAPVPGGAGICTGNAGVCAGTCTGAGGSPRRFGGDAGSPGDRAGKRPGGGSPRPGGCHTAGGGSPGGGDPGRRNSG